MIDRRAFLRTSALLGLAGVLRVRGADAPAVNPQTANVQTLRYKVGVCDWMILKRQKLGAFKWAADIGAHGVEVDMGGLGKRPTFDNKLVDPAVRQQFVDEARKFGLEICSIAMSGFYAQSFAEREGVEQMVADCIATAVSLNVKTTFLPLGVLGDLVQRPQLRPAIVSKLKAIAPVAEKAGVVIGLETALDAAGELKLLGEVGSPSVRSYFNFSNPLQNGRDLISEIKLLGKEHICQIHCTNQDGARLREDQKLNLRDVKTVLDDIGWSGWLVMERSRDAARARDVLWNFGDNAQYLKDVFNRG